MGNAEADGVECNLALLLLKVVSLSLNDDIASGLRSRCMPYSEMNIST